MREERAPGLWGNSEREIAVNTHIWCWIEEELTKTGAIQSLPCHTLLPGALQ